MGIILPKVRIRDNMRLEQNQYRIKIADASVAEGVVPPGQFLAIDSGATAGKIPGTPTRDPAFGTPALWIDPGIRDHAEMLGYTVVEPGSVIRPRTLPKRFANTPTKSSPATPPSTSSTNSSRPRRPWSVSWFPA